MRARWIVVLLGLGLFSLGMLAPNACAEENPWAWSLGSDDGSPPLSPPPTGEEAEPAIPLAEDVTVSEDSGFPPPAPCLNGDPCPAPCFAPADCCAPPPNPCCQRVCRHRISIWGSYTLANDPEGTFGLQAFTGSQMTWDVLSYSGAFGGGASWDYTVNKRDRVELAGAYFGKWDDSGRTAGNFAFAPPVPGVSLTNSATLTSEAELFSGEFNYWHATNDNHRSRWDFGGGIRFIDFTEKARADQFGMAFNPGFPGQPFVQSESKNRFIGAQFVAARRFVMGSRWEGSIGAKAMLGNMRRELTVSDSSIFSGGQHNAAKNTEDTMTFGIEMSFDLRYRISRSWSLFAGYKLLALDDIVRANDAMDFSKSFSGAVQAQQETDQAFFHSLFFGISLDI